MLPGRAPIAQHEVVLLMPADAERNRFQRHLQTGGRLVRQPLKWAASCDCKERYHTNFSVLR